ncbi:hypothetical protein TGAMA5MH_00455 [Trichoderma gamsii]|uniref:Uncharacterized protein n=1 Tax=Trichoderma gamsii TaxID=398673 RepID=A0A2K0TSB1_9HYPO|nr:hypothetical protein TGAMA5MH_00455 [Trichoderma gamsii]
MSDIKKVPPVYFDGVKVRTVDATTMEKLSNIMSNIIELKVNGTKSLDERIIKGLSSILNDQSAEHREFILAFCCKFYEICHELCRPEDEECEPDIWDFDASTPNNSVSPEPSKPRKDKQPNISPGIKSIFNNAMIDKGETVSQLEPTDDTSYTSSQDTTKAPLFFEGENSGDDDSEDELAYLRKQTIDDFIDDARDQLRRIGAAELPAQKPANIAALLDSLGDNSKNFPNGPEWLSLVEKGYSDRQRGTLYYALAAVGFENWHRHQVEKFVQLYPDKQLATAKLEVSSIIHSVEGYFL